jgi:hypothetical protein
VDSRHDKTLEKTDGRKRLDSKLSKHADAVDQVSILWNFSGVADDKTKKVTDSIKVEVLLASKEDRGLTRKY